jgi:7,8-dihydropterin-6-yl-methyl-4-(beta-D-ribofuranosyl)aminobenzene 5'-phosphate synthase
MVELQPVDAVEVTLVVDNFVDILLAGADGVRRLPLAYDQFDQGPHRDRAAPAPAQPG